LKRITGWIVNDIRNYVESLESSEATGGIIKNTPPS
jgi:hypothetical protein